MKKLLLLLFVTATFVLSAQTTNIPDANFEQALIDLGYDSGAIDGVVTTANISGIITLSLINANISDLTGIEDFTAVTTLFVSDNSLTTLDLSNNLNLTTLNCGSNQLNSLIISNNANLNALGCYNNQLTALDTSNNTALTEIQCYNNSINNLDVSNNTALTKLNCFNNQLTSLNVKNGNNANFTIFSAISNPNLTCIEVDNASYSTANWANIDATATFSENCVGGIAMTLIPDANFEQELINLGHDSGTPDSYVPTANINSITSLNVDNKNIADLKGINDFVSLQTLVCSNNQLTSLDISQLTALSYFDCNFNQLANLDVTTNTSLTVLGCRGNSLTAIDVSFNLLLQYFSCRENLITDIDVTKNVDLVRLWCSDNQLTSLDVKNGNNTNISVSNFNATNNPNLTCINVDDENYSYANWVNIDATASFNTNCTLSVNQFDLENAFNIYPNPVKEQFTIQNNSEFIIDTIGIYTMLGKLIYQSKDIQNSIDVSDLSNGMYLVKLNSNNKIITKKIIINK